MKDTNASAIDVLRDIEKSSIEQASHDGSGDRVRVDVTQMGLDMVDLRIEADPNAATVATFHVEAVATSKAALDMTIRNSSRPTASRAPIVTASAPAA